jgi:hypothetical protein
MHAIFTDRTYQSAARDKALCVSERECPLCKAPRPRGAKRCICNYTFEYEQPPRLASPVRPGSGMTSLIACVALAGAIVAGGLASGVDQKPDGLAPVVMIGAGMFAVAGALNGWRWFFSSRRARRFVWLLGATGARAFYALLGGALAGGGVGFLS